MLSTKGWPKKKKNGRTGIKQRLKVREREREREIGMGIGISAKCKKRYNLNTLCFSFPHSPSFQTDPLPKHMDTWIGEMLLLWQSKSIREDKQKEGKEGIEKKRQENKERKREKEEYSWILACNHIADPLFTIEIDGLVGLGCVVGNLPQSFVLL